MEKKTAKEIIDFIKSEKNQEYYYDFVNNCCKHDRDAMKVFSEELGNCELVYEEGGHEGGGENVERVIYFKDHDIYIEIDGYYCSNEGCNYEDSEPYEVKPKEISIIKYFIVE